MYPEQNGELPSITVPEAAGKPQAAEAPVPAMPELRNSPVPSGRPDPAASAAMPPMAAPPMTPVAANPPMTPAAQGGAPAIADDVDLIEKEWVEKAKEIVAMTQSEPFEQKQQVDQLKTDYLQKRYNKTIKVSES
jgi:hypothetical protein